MAYCPPPSWGNRSASAFPPAYTGQGGYQGARPGANMPNGTPVQRNNAAQTQTPAAANLASAQQQPASRPQADGTASTATPSIPPNSGAAQNTVGSQPGQIEEYISQKICKIHAKNKVIDFNSKLKKAYLNDFANVHGCGGSGHAGNSTIGLTICDSTKGTGTNSVTVKYSVDVEIMAILYEAAQAARLGKLQPDISAQMQWLLKLEHLVNAWAQIPPTPNGDRLIPRQSLNDVYGILQDAKNAFSATVGTPVFTYSKEKNNPYKIDGDGFSPCSKVTISYSPFRRDGQPSSYPWYVGIENFDAPVSKQENGAISHNSKQAKNKKSAFINLSVDDFASAMVAVDRFVRLWEQVNMGPVMAEAYRRMDTAKAQNSANIHG